MSLQIIYGRAGSGKTTACFEIIKKNYSPNEDILYMVPEQFSLQTEQKILKSFPGSSVNVLSFTLLARRIFSRVGPVYCRYIDECTKQMLMQSILIKLDKKLTYFAGAYETEGLSAVLTETINELKRHNITPETLKSSVDSLNGQLKLKLADISLIYEEYNKQFVYPLADEEDILSVALEKIRAHDLFRGAHVIFDSFNSFSPRQLSVIEEFMRRAGTVMVALCTDSVMPPDSIADIFYSSKICANKLFSLAQANNVAVLPNIYTGECKKYRRGGELSHIEENYFKYPAVKYQGPAENVVVFAANNYYGEVESAAVNILRLCREKKCRFRDIAVITKAMDTYSPLIRSLFDEYGILYHINEKSSALQHSLTRAILALFDIVIHNFDYESVFMWLKSDYCGACGEDIFLLENYVLACATTPRMWKSPDDWTFLPRGFDKEELQRINEIKNRVRAPIVSFAEKFSGRKTAYEISLAFTEFLYESGVEKRVREKILDFRKRGLIEKSNLLSTVWNAVVSTLDSLTCAFGDSYITFEKYRSVFISGLRAFEIGEIPPTVDEVLVCGADRFYNRDIKYLFVLGTSNGVFPASYKNEGLLTDSDRQALNSVNIELSDTTEIKQAGESFLIYSALTAPLEKLFLFYPIADNEGAALYPSTIIDRIKTIFPQLNEQTNVYKTDDILPFIEGADASFNKMLTDRKRFAQVEAWFAKNRPERLKKALAALSYTNLPKRLSPDTVALLYGSSPKGSISRAEQYNKCGFAYYLRYGLFAAEREKDVIEPADAGSFMHEIIEQFSGFASQVGWQNLSEEQIREKISEITDGVIEKSLSEAYTSSPRFKYLSKKIKNIMSTTAKSIAEFYNKTPFVPLGYEISFGEGGAFPPIELDINGTKVLLGGKVDRADVWRTKNGNYISIVDYKSGSKSIDYSEVLCGIQIQLPVYINAVCEALSRREGVRAMPAAMLYYKFDSPVVAADRGISEEEVWAEVQKKLKMQGITLDSEEVQEGINTLFAVKSPTTAAQIDTVCSVAHKQLLKAFREILRGNISINPVRSYDYTACDGCPYASICLFDTNLQGNKYRNIKKVSKEEFFDHVGKMDE